MVVWFVEWKNEKKGGWIRTVEERKCTNKKVVVLVVCCCCLLQLLVPVRCYWRNRLLLYLYLSTQLVCQDVLAWKKKRGNRGIMRGSGLFVRWLVRQTSLSLPFSTATIFYIFLWLLLQPIIVCVFF